MGGMTRLVAKSDPLWTGGAATFIVLGVCMVALGIAGIKRAEYHDKWVVLMGEQHPAFLWLGNIGKIIVGAGLICAGTSFLIGGGQ